MEIRFITQPFEANGNPFFLGEKICALIKSKKPQYNKIWLVASFAKLSGIINLRSAIKRAIKNGTEIKFILGINNHLTTAQTLLEILELGCKAKVFRSVHGSSLGAKLFCFEADNQKAEVIINSGNITEGGLYKNNELVVNITYDLSNEEDKEKYSDFQYSVSNFLNPKEDLAFDLSEELINILLDNGEIISKSEKNESLKKKVKKKAIEEKESDSADIDIQTLSIELPTGDSIEVSLNEIEDLSEKLVEVNNNKESIEEKKESQPELEQLEDVNLDNDEFDIEIEGIENVVSALNQKVSELVKTEVADCETDINDNNDKKSKLNESLLVNGYDAIDIEQMLYMQSHEGDAGEQLNDRQAPSISEEDMALIKKKKKSRSAVKKDIREDDIIEEAPKDSIKRKFIIASRLNKASGGIINAFFIQINKLKGKGLTGEVRMPVASRDFSPEFWGWPNKYILTQSEGKRKKKSKRWKVSCKVIDVENPETSQIDIIDLYQEEGKSNFYLYSKVLGDFCPDESDIIRIIRCSEGSESVFQCELIRHTSKEYIIWEQFCSLTIKGTERRYGFA